MVACCCCAAVLFVLLGFVALFGCLIMVSHPKPMSMQLLHRSFDLAEIVGKASMFRSYGWPQWMPQGLPMPDIGRLPGLQMLGSLPALAPAWRQ